MAAVVQVPAAPFHEAAALKTFLQETFYKRGLKFAPLLPLIVQFYGVSSLEELLAIPATCNSGQESTFGPAWFSLMSFVDMDDQWVDVDDVVVGDGGYSFIFWGRFNGACNGAMTFPDGTKVDLAGKRFSGQRYAYKIFFSRESKKAVRFEGMMDIAEWGRRMGSPEFARNAGEQSIYPA